MNVRAVKKTSVINESTKQFAIICALLVSACVLGAAVITVGGSSSSQTVAFGVLAFLAIGGMLCMILELPVITAVRFAFIASFFFKGEINLYKIDEIEDPSGFNLSLTLLTALILLIYDQFADNETIREKTFPAAFSFLSLALFGCALVSVLYSGSTMLGWFSLWSFSTSVLVAFVIASHFSRRERLVQLIVGTAIGLLLTGVVALSQYAFDFPTNLAFFGTGTEEEMLGTQSEILSRVPAFLRTPTEMAWVVSTLLPLVIAPLVCRAKSFCSWQKIILYIAAFSGIIAVILSLARGSWISLLAAMAALVLFGWLRLSAAEKKSYLISVGGVLILSCLLLTPFAGRIHERLTADDDGSALIRVPLMETAVRMIKDNSLVGVGMNGYRASMTKYDETDIFVSQVFPNPVHNVFAHITAEVGVPGGIIFCLLILAALFECIKAMSLR
ncbi:MAG TPA: O-antigen ligase family protein, partial [Pyrinomonadaceae bacterium]|nr:O-antigen ligase family protein [Pyrinomonadaceae bacterium]